MYVTLINNESFAWFFIQIFINKLKSEHIRMKNTFYSLIVKKETGGTASTEY